MWLVATVLDSKDLPGSLWEFCLYVTKVKQNWNLLVPSFLIAFIEILFPTKIHQISVTISTSTLLSIY